MNISELYLLFQQYPSVQTDTRKIQPGDLFFALKGPNFNGNAFAGEALGKGAAYAIIDDEQFGTDERCIRVDDVLGSLQLLARHHRSRLNIPFIAITGSNGKTTSKELLTQVLRQKYNTYATPGNLNNHIGVPLTILGIKNDAEIAVIEMGANHQKEISAYCEIAMPDFGIINNCGKAHIEGFGGIEGVRKGKGELYDYIREHGGSIFRNTDLDYLESMSAGIPQQITYGSTGYPTIKGNITGDALQLNVQIQTPGSTYEIATQLVGAYNLPNVVLAAAVGFHFGVADEAIRKAIEDYSPDNSRSQLLQAGSNRIVMDAYNANPTSMRAAITHFAGQNGKKHLWIGAMKEMGDTEEQEHQDLINFIQQWAWEDVILVGKEFESVQHTYQWFPDSESAKESIAKNKPRNAFILIKGSRGSKMEHLLAVL